MNKTTEKKLFQLNLSSILLILVIALVPRFFCASVEISIWPDSNAYLNSTQALLTGQYQNFYVERTPGYPLFLASIITVLKFLGYSANPELLKNTVAIVQALLGAATALLCAEISIRVFNNAKWALAAGIICALSPNLIFYEHSVLTESLYGFLMTLYCLSLFWVNTGSKTWLAVVTSIIASLTLWTRHIALVAVIISAISFWLHKKQKLLITYAAIVFLAVGSWVGYHIQHHNIVAFSAGSGLNQLYKVVDFVDYKSSLQSDFKKLLWQRRQIHPPQRTYEAVNDVHVLHTVAEKQEPNPRPYYQIYLADDQAAAQIVKETVFKKPVAYVMSTLRQYYQLLVPGTQWDPHSLYWAPVFLLAIIGFGLLLKQQPKVNWLKTPGILVGFIVTSHLLLYPWMTVCVPRYRIPLEPLLVVFAVYGTRRLWQTHQALKE